VERGKGSRILDTEGKKGKEPGNKGKGGERCLCSLGLYHRSHLLQRKMFFPVIEGGGSCKWREFFVGKKSFLLGGMSLVKKRVRKIRLNRSSLTEGRGNAERKKIESLITAKKTSITLKPSFWGKVERLRKDLTIGNIGNGGGEGSPGEKENKSVSQFPEASPAPGAD